MSENAVADLKLLSPRLVSLTLISKQPYVTGEISIGNSDLNVSSEVSQSKRRIQVRINYSVATDLNGSELFNLGAVYEGVFEYKEGLIPAAIDNFAKLNAPAIIYPYLRSVVSMATLSGGFPPLSLPVINFQKLNVHVTSVE